MFSQFIYGKFIRDPYEFNVTARTRDLTDRDQLADLAKEHRFWRITPRMLNAAAIGMFVKNDCLVLCQAALAVDQQGKLFEDYFEREIPQHRYVLLPLKETEKWQRSLFQILSWLSRQPIPAFPLPVSYQEGQTIELPPLEPPEFEPDLQQVEVVRRALVCSNQQGTPLLLDAINAVSNRQRILTHFSTAQTIDFLKSFLLLLPIALRHQFSIAMGIFAEECCDWADLLLKLDLSPYDVPSGVIQLDQETVLKTRSDYVTEIVQPVLQESDAQLEQFLARLNTVPEQLKPLQSTISPASSAYLMQLQETFFASGSSNGHSK